MSKITTFVRHPIISVKSKLRDYRHNKISYFIKDENFSKLSDKKAIKVRYYYIFGRYPNLRNPERYTEKLQWLKLYNRRPEYTKLVDKYEVKKIVADIIGEEYIIPTLGVWNDADEIDFNALPDKFVLKCTHDSKSVTICKDKSALDVAATKEKLNSHLKKSQFVFGREWPYKNVKPRIIAEEYLENQSNDELTDYKFFCFNGKPKVLLIVTERFASGAKRDFYDIDGNHLSVKDPYPAADIQPAAPENLSLMKELAEKLSAGFPHIRADFYECGGKVYFGELTFFHDSGFSKFSPESWDYTLGNYISLPKKKIRDRYNEGNFI